MRRQDRLGRCVLGGWKVRLLVVLLLLPLGLAAGGCFDVSPGGPRPGGDDGTPAPDDGEPDGGDSPDDQLTPPSVRLSASNVSPQPGEELQLRCEVTAGSDAAVTFEFQPDLGGLVVDGRAGTASLVIEDIDVGIAYSFTCTGTNSSGTGPASDAVLVIASDPIGPDSTP